MSIKFTCPHCQAKLSVSEEYAGKPGKCKGCGMMLTAPLLSDVTEASRPQGDLPPAQPAVEDTSELVEAATSQFAEAETMQSGTIVSPFSLSRSTLPTIAAIARDGVVKSAVKSLSAWGIINIVGWLTLTGKFREQLAKLSGALDNPTAQVLLYGVLLIAGLMLVFAVLGAVTSHQFTILLDGASLCFIGVWNIIHDFLLVSVIAPYGYTIQPSVFWILLGICQLIWGYRQFGRYSVVASWPRDRVSSEEKGNVRAALTNLLREPDSVHAGRITGTRTIRGPLGLYPLDRVVRYFGELTDDCALIVSQGMDDFLCIDRDVASSRLDGARKLISVEVGWQEVTVEFNSLSMLAMKRWSGIAVSADDVRHAVMLGKAQLAQASDSSRPTGHGNVIRELLSPYLECENEDVREAAVEGLESLELAVESAVSSAKLQPEMKSAQGRARKYFATAGIAGGIVALLVAVKAFTWARNLPPTSNSIQPGEVMVWALVVAVVQFFALLCGTAAVAPCFVLDNSHWIGGSSDKGTRMMLAILSVLAFFGVWGLMVLARG